MIGEHPDWQRWTPEERQAFVDREQGRWLESLPDLPDAGPQDCDECGKEIIDPEDYCGCDD